MSQSKKCLALGSDPRKDAKDGHVFGSRCPEEMEPPMDTPAFFGLLLSMAGMLLKNKAIVWSSLILALSAVAKFNWRTADTKQITSSVVFSIAGLIATYASMRSS